MIHILMISFMVPAASAASSPPAHLEGVKCAREGAELLEKWKVTGPWENLMAPVEGLALKRSPSEAVGVWAETRVSGGRLEISRVTPRTTTAVKFDDGDCTPKLSVVERSYDDARMAAAFTDEALAERVKSGKPGIVYAWSPHMALSLRGIEQAREAARKLGAELTLVLDPVADGNEAARAAQKARLGADALRRLESIDLMFRGMTGHYPSMVVYSKGRVSSWANPGYQPSDRYVRFARERWTQ